MSFMILTQTKIQDIDLKISIHLNSTYYLNRIIIIYHTSMSASFVGQ